MHIKRDDKVQVTTGKYKGVIGKVLEAQPKEGRVIVEGVNIRTKHQKPQGMHQPGGIVKTEGPIDASNVLLYCEKCKKGVRTRIEMSGDKKVRVCTRCGEKLDK